jgi:hypothetical protein
MAIDELACAIGERGGALDERLRLAVVVAACCARSVIAQREIIAARRSVDIGTSVAPSTVCRIGTRGCASAVTLFVFEARRRELSVGSFMASIGPPPPANFSVDGPSWRLQSLHHSPCIAPSNLTTGGFKNWTDVPRLPRDDPMIQDQLRPGRRNVTGPSSSEPFGLGAEPFGESGKKVVGPHYSEAGGYGKRIYPEITGARSTDERPPHGLKRVESRARRDTPGVSDPNAVVAYTVLRPEGCKMFEGRNTVQYSAWKPEELNRAEYGDWNWNTKLGFRKVKLMESGEPKRVESTPVAFPEYKGYPPDLDSHGNRIDYALKKNGGSFNLKSQGHPDVIASRANRANASVTPVSASTQPTLYRRGIY